MTTRQAAIMSELDHPNLVSIYDFYQDDPKHFYMVLELMSGGELFDRIVQKVRGGFDCICVVH